MRLEPCPLNQELLCGRLIWVWDPDAVRAGSIGSLMLQGFTWDRGAWQEPSVAAQRRRAQARGLSVSPRPYPNATVIQAGLGPEPTAIQLARPRLDIAPASAGYRVAGLSV